MRNMKILDDLLARVELFNDELTSGDLISEFLRQNEEEIVELNTQNQLFDQGIDSEGIEIMRYQPYSPYTIEIKEMEGLPSDRVTLFETGDFHSSFTIQTDADSFSITATDSKTEDLRDRYGDDIFGLIGDNKAEVSQMLLPYLLQEAKNIIYKH